MSVHFWMIALVDERVGVVLDTLERTGLREDIIVLFCSDHGDFMGEHHSSITCNAFYDCLTRVPPLLSCPRLDVRARRCTEPVSLVDVMPTFLQLVGLPGPPAVQGRVLPGLPGLEQTAHRPDEAVCAEYGAGGPPVTLADVARLFPPGTPRPLHPSLREAHGKMVRTARWKYTHDVTGEVDELYELQGDPGSSPTAPPTPPTPLSSRSCVGT